MLQMAGSSPAQAAMAPPPSLLARAPEARSLLEQALDVLDDDPLAARRILDRVNLFLSGDVERASAAPAQPALARGGLAPWQLRQVREYIDGHIAETIHIDTLAEVARLSSSHFCRAFKTSTGETAHRYIMRRRVDRAQAMMLDSHERLCQIAVACGLADQAHLTRLFRRFTGQTPFSWRRAYRVEA